VNEETIPESVLNMELKGYVQEEDHNQERNNRSERIHTDGR
jgi:hypothetical protein